MSTQVRKLRVVVTGVGGLGAEHVEFDTAMTDRGVWMKQKGKRGSSWRLIAWDEVYFGARSTDSKPGE